MKSKWISLKNLKIHEFNTTLRRLDKEERGWARKFEILSELENKASKRFATHCGQLLITYLIMTSLRDDTLLSVKFSGVEASVPASYFMAAVGFLFMIASISFCHLSAVMSARVRTGAKMTLPGFSAEIFRMLKGNDDNSLGIPTFQNSHLKEVFPTSKLLASTMLLGLFSALLPMLAFGAFLVQEQLSFAFDSKLFAVERLAAVAGIILTVFSLVNVLLFHTPMLIKKDSFSIRWGVLIYLTKDEHPQQSKWLSK